MRTTLNAVRIAAGIVCGACASAPIRVPLVGSETAIATLAGEWSGDYVGTDSKRTGSITFRLRAGDTTAFGDVVMIPRAYQERGWTREQAVPPTHLPALLPITFVHVVDGSVSGALDPYMDPECDCLVITTFAGRRTSPTTMSGTFVTRTVSSSAYQRGTWSVKLQR